jgi:hypothetical protein
VVFDAGWEPGRLAEEVCRLPADRPWRWAALVEMVKVDLERRWAGGERPGLAEYVRAFPELSENGEPPTGLLRAETEVRAEFGADPSESSPWVTGEAGGPEAIAPDRIPAALADAAASSDADARTWAAGEIVRRKKK